MELGQRHTRWIDHLPKHHTSFHGREGEAAAITAKLTAGARQVTIVGPGGVGKTRLATVVARSVASLFTGRVCFVALDEVIGPESVLPAILTGLGIGESIEARDLIDRIAEYIGDSRCLLLIDNFEHVLDAAPSLRTLLDGCPGLSILATSRRPLRIEPEQVVPLEPLGVPPEGVPVAQVWASPSVSLFVDRAKGAGGTIGAGDADVVASIARRLDGLPLAIELAAAGMWSAKSASEILSGLEQILPALTEGRRDVAERQRTMSNTIAWSYNLLSSEEQALFRRLSVFSGGFHVEIADRLVRGRAANGPCPYADGYGVPYFGFGEVPGVADPYIFHHVERSRKIARALKSLSIDIEEGTNALVDKSLLVRTEGREGDERFVMLETVREFGLAQLEASGESDAVRYAHAAAVAAFAEASTVALWSSLWLCWGIDRIQDELGNIRSAIAWGESQGADGAELALRTADAIWPFWQYRGLVNEGRALLERALTYKEVTPWARTGALSGLAMLCWIQGDDARAEAILEENDDVNQSIGFELGTARVRLFRSFIAWRRGAYDEMKTLLEEALRLFPIWKDMIGHGITLTSLGVYYRITGNPARALELFDQAIEIQLQQGHRWGVATSRYYAAETKHDLKDVAGAAILLDEALERYWQLGDGWGSGAVTSAIAVALAESGQAAHAARLFGAAETLLKLAGAFLPPTELQNHGRVATSLRGTIGSSHDDNFFAEGRSWPPDTAAANARELAAALGVGQIVEEPRAMTIKSDGAKVGNLGLTARQIEIGRMLVSGSTVEEIAVALFVSPKTIYGHLMEAKKRCGAKTDGEFVAHLIRAGLA